METEEDATESLSSEARLEEEALLLLLAPQPDEDDEELLAKSTPRKLNLAPEKRKYFYTKANKEKSRENTENKCSL